MIPRERVLAALAHCPPDRAPRDFWAEEPAWSRLLQYLGREDRERVLCDLGIDLRHLDIASPAERLLAGGVYQNFWGERYVYRPTPWGPAREDVAAHWRARSGSPTSPNLSGPHRINATIPI